MDNPLSKLALDYWYQVLMVVSFVVFLSAGAGVLSASFPTIPTAVISLGCFFVGLGEWINHPLQTALMSATAYHPGGVITSHPRNPRFVGVAFDVLGAILIVFGLYRLLA
ncbi:hypothetical protein ACQE3E_12125 [Methylomonas sp. MED-D]|uniref:hypothetical protein n=1 Tax=unclassified Methylomonas TaxID=2608980 RepID=UPI0028A44B14|nr:hypothetical protein [Methylomonas sp. MV1]MDT4331834.1 hypothetical protein [Methylomonas sp. MV1]